MVNWIQCCTNFNLLNLMLHFVLPSSSSLFTIFQLSSTAFGFFGLSTIGSSLTFSVLFLLFCYFYFYILFSFMSLCLFIANSVYYANKLPNIETAAISNSLAHKSWIFAFWKERYGMKYITFLIMKLKPRLKILEISVNIGIHEWPIYRYQYQPQKSHIDQSLIPTHCACEKTKSVDHSLICKLGGCTSTRHNSVRDSETQIMRGL